MGELRQHHPSLRISKVKALQKGDLLVVGDSPRDAVILQSEPKMKAALGKNVRVSLPKASKTSTFSRRFRHYFLFGTLVFPRHTSSLRMPN